MGAGEILGNRKAISIEEFTPSWCGEHFAELKGMRLFP
jgi:hypothetical protein